jgi:diacylglycerol O-acyltransferase / wax synthase
MATRLSGVEAVSLHTHTSMTPAHTVALIVIEESHQLSHERLHQLLASSLPQLARFRSRLVGKPLGIGQPLWAEIDHYDPTSQIHSATVHAPGGRRELADLIAQLCTGTGGRQPLWQAWSIDGLAGGRWALAVKMSPVLTDGDAGPASIWMRLLTAGPHDDPTHELPTQPSLGSASVVDLVTDVVTELVENNVTGAWLAAEAVTGVLEGVRRRLRGSDETDMMSPAVSSMSGPVPHTAFNAPLTQRRAIALASISLADVQAISNAFGGSITNVFLAACTLSLRSWLQRHDTVPDDPLLIRMPLALPAADPTTMGNPSAVGRIRLPVQLDDPVQVLTNLHTAAERLNTERRHSAEKEGPALDFVTIASLIPPAIFRAGLQLYNSLGLRRRFAPITHGRVTNISGRPAVGYCAGAKVVGMYSVAPLVEGCGLNITVTPRGEALDLGVCVCPDNVPAVNDIATGIAESVQILLAAAKKSPRGHGRSVVTELTSHGTNGQRAGHL